MARQQAVVSSAAGLVPFGHLGWGYRDRAEFYCRAGEYIADGLRQNQWVEYVGGGGVQQLRAELAALPGMSDVSDIKVTTARDFYAVSTDDDVVDPDTAVAHRVEAVERAIAEGYTGFRAVSDATAVTLTPAQRDAFARFEFLIDRKMAVLPVSALCAYDLRQLADDAPALACLHPFVNAASPTFRLYAEPGTDFALAGEVDAAGDRAFTEVLHRIWPPAEPKMAIDAHDLEFIGHRQLLALDRLARDSGTQVVVRTRQRIPTRLVELLELTNVRVEPAADAG